MTLIMGVASKTSKIQKLTVLVQDDYKTDIAIIFAEPDLKDVESLFKEHSTIVKCINYLLSTPGQDITKQENDLDAVTELAELIKKSKSNKHNKEEKNNDNVKNEEDSKNLLDIEIKDEFSEHNQQLTSDDEELEGFKQEKVKPKRGRKKKGDNISVLEKKSTTKVPKLDPDLEDFSDDNNIDDGEISGLSDADDDFSSESKKRKSSNKLDPPSKRIARYPCETCDKVFYKPCRLERHFKNHHASQKCDFCGESVSNKKAMRQHIKVAHSNEVEGNFPCSLCDKKLYSEKYLKIHIEKVHDTARPSTFMCQECGKTFEQRSSLKSHIEIQHEKLEKFSCQECDQKFLTYYRLTCHMEKVHTDKAEVFMCTKCGKQIVGKNRFQKHVNHHPLNFKMVPCTICELMFSESQLKCHMKEMHSNKKMRYQCPYCPKKMEKRAFIRCHVRTHTGAKPYCCIKCDKYYISSASVRRHLRDYHRGDLSLMKYDREIDSDNPFAKIKSKL